MSEATMNREEIHDQQINPLVDQIIEICSEHGIPLLMSFYLPTEDDPGLFATTALIGKPESAEWPEPPENLLRAVIMLLEGQEIVKSIGIGPDKGAHQS